MAASEPGFTALMVHALFAVVAVISTFGSPHGTFLLGLLKALRLIWNMTGVGAAAYLVFMELGMINGRHFLQARTAALGALFLPLLGSYGR